MNGRRVILTGRLRIEEPTAAVADDLPVISRKERLI
jgi:hypothetical protein